MNCLAGVGREPGEKYEEGRRGRGENYQHLELISNQSRSGSISSVSFHCYEHHHQFITSTQSGELTEQELHVELDHE